MNNFLYIMKALSDETRLKILDLLMNYDFCVSALSRRLNISEAAVSQHLKVLRNANIVICEKRGYYNHYDINRELLLELSREINIIATKEIERKGCRQHLTGNHKYCENKLNRKKE